MIRSTRGPLFGRFLAGMLAGIALIGGALTAPAHAALPPLIPREVLFADPVQDHPEISPDGRRLAWAKRGADGVVNLWVRDLDGSDARQVTFDPKRGVRHGFWTGDSQRLLFLQDHEGDENEHLWVVDLATGSSRDLTPFEGRRVEGVHGDAAHPGSVLIGLNRRDPAVFDVYRVDLATGDVVLDTQNPGDVIDWTTDADFVVRACTALRPSDGATELRVRDSADSPWRTIVTWSMDDAVIDRAQKILGFLDDRTLLVQSWVGSETSRLVTMDARDGRQLAVLANDPRCDVWNQLALATFTPQFLLSADGKRLEAVAFEHLKVEWKVLDPAVQADFDSLAVAARGSSMEIVGRDRADRRWIVRYFADREPGRFVLWDREHRRATELFRSAPALGHWTLAETQPRMVKASDGVELPCYLTLPAGVPAKNLPLVVNPHGGPWFRDEWEWNPEAQWLANRGYAVLQVEFGSSTGFGKALTLRGNLQYGSGRTQQDLVDAVNWTIAQGIVDPRRIGIMGWSFGGYATLAGLAFRPELFTCGVDGVGPGNLKTLIESFPPYWSARKQRWLARMGNVVADDSLNRRLSPFYHVDAIRAPLLVGQGANDPRVKLAEAEAMVNELRAHHRDVTFVVYPDEGHGFQRVENNRDFYGRAEEFLMKHLGGRAEPWQAVEGSTADVRVQAGVGS